MTTKESTTGHKVLILAGYRYSGRSLTLQLLEAAGYTCVDNLPASLVQDYLSHGLSGEGTNRFAIAIDTSSPTGPQALELLLDRLEKEGQSFNFVFIEAGASILKERANASEDKRSELGLGESNDSERSANAELRQRSHLILDSSYSSPIEIRDRIIALVEGGIRDIQPVVDIQSFGYKYGPPSGDLVLDLRFLPNPYYVAALRPLTGNDEQCASYVMSQEAAQTTLAALGSLIQGMIPAYAKQGRSTIRVRIGCTGGRHRSVAMVEALGRLLEDKGFSIRLRHREMDDKRY